MRCGVDGVLDHRLPRVEPGESTAPGAGHLLNRVRHVGDLGEGDRVEPCLTQRRGRTSTQSPAYSASSTNSRTTRRAPTSVTPDVCAPTADGTTTGARGLSGSRD